MVKPLSAAQWEPMMAAMRAQKMATAATSNKMRNGASLPHWGAVTNASAVLAVGAVGQRAVFVVDGLPSEGTSAGRRRGTRAGRTISCQCGQ